MQIVGLGIPLAAIFLQFNDAISVTHLLVAMVFAAALFYAGRLVEGLTQK